MKEVLLKKLEKEDFIREYLNIYIDVITVKVYYLSIFQIIIVILISA